MSLPPFPSQIHQRLELSSMRNVVANAIVYNSGDIEMTEAQKIQKVHDLVSGMHACMLTTKDGNGTLRSRPMGVQAADFDGDLWFFTSRSSRKFDELEADSHVSVSFSDLKANNFVSLTGDASFVEDRNKMRELWKPILKTWFPQGVDDPDLALFVVRCHEAEYWDGPSGLGMALALAKSYVTGHAPPLGENETVAL